MPVERSLPRMLFVLMSCLVLLALAGGAAAIVMQQRTSFSSSRIGGPFVMVDMDGQRVTEADLAGKPTVLYFGYTACPDVCPTTLASLTNVLAKMGKDANGMNIVFATVDPQHDTPQALKAYLASFDPHIRGFTGTEAQVAAMTDAFHIYRKRSSSKDGTYEFAHTANALLLDRRERMVGEIYYGEDEASMFAKLTTLSPPPVCRLGGPGPADLWAHAATFGPGQLCGSDL